MTAGTVVLAIEELKAIDQIAQATVPQLREALRRVPQYQRHAVRWLARELAAEAPTQAQSPRALERQRARRAAIRERQELQGAIDQSGATAEQKAHLSQGLAHLWTYFETALQEARREP